MKMKVLNLMISQPHHQLVHDELEVVRIQEINKPVW